MKTIKKAQLKKETKKLEEIYKQHGRVNKTMQDILGKKGYELCELGTSSRCYTASGMVGKKFFANDSEEYFGIGIYNVAVKCRSNGISVRIYRAWVKKIEN